jgi:hypothetical protein
VVVYWLHLLTTDRVCFLTDENSISVLRTALEQISTWLISLKARELVEDRHEEFTEKTAYRSGGCESIDVGCRTQPVDSEEPQI